MVYSYLNNVIFRTYKLINLYISPSLFLVKVFKKSNLFNDRDILHLPCFIDVDKYNPRFDATENTIVYFGRLDIDKGMDILIEAVRGLNISLKIIVSI